MKLNINILLQMLAVAAVGVLSSCSESCDIADLTQSKQLTITASVMDASRAVFEKEQFANNDQIGLFVIPAEGSTITNVQSTTATFNNGKWTLAKNFDMADFTSVQVMAYYPYKGVEADYNAEKQCIEYKKIDLSTNQSDILTSTIATVDKASGLASLAFGHTLTCLSLNLTKADTYNGAGYIKEAYLEGGYNASPLMSNGIESWLSDGTEKGNVKVMDCNVTLTDKPYKCQVLVFPQAMETTYKLVINVDDDEYLYTLPVGQPYAGYLWSFNIVVDSPIQNTPDVIYFNGFKGTYLGINSNGTPLYWAESNVGAESAENPGQYFSWGSINPYDISNEKDYQSPMASGSISGTKYDAARAIMGSEWRIPTVDEYNQLLYSGTSEAAEINGISGWIFTGPNGNSIFVPNGGCYFGDHLYSLGEAGYLWTSDSTNETMASALNLSWASALILPNWTKTQGCNIRAVISL